MPRLAILGSTGSIGTAAVEVVQHLRTIGHAIEVTALSTHTRIDLLIDQARLLRPAVVAITGDPPTLAQTRELSELGAMIKLGGDALREIAAMESSGAILHAVVGAAGLAAAMGCVERGGQLLLANKESLVVAGHLLMPLAKQKGATVLPIDSEHSAIFQAMQAGRHNEIARVILTASGGPFRARSVEQMRSATPKDAMSHPTYAMGRKISVDSATMFNKALEIIEAKWLFDLAANQIEVVVHPESVVHSMVEFIDGSTIAQMSPPDMRTAIQYAITHPHRLEKSGPTLDFATSRVMHFEPPDLQRFPAVRLGMEAARAGGSAGCVLNAANEVAVEAFLAEQIGFASICEAVEHTIAAHPLEPDPPLERLYAIDAAARATTRNYLESRSNRHA